MSTTFSQQILSGKLLMTIASRQKGNFSGVFKLKFRINNNLPHTTYCKNVGDIASS